MKTTLRERRYAQAHFHEVHHTTLDPEGPGVVRIHLVPPVLKDGEVGASVAILNGLPFIITVLQATNVQRNIQGVQCCQAILYPS